MTGPRPAGDDTPVGAVGSRDAGDGMSSWLDSSTPFLLDGADQAWLVTAGEVDVFVVPIDDTGNHGRRLYVGSTGVGALLVGVDPVVAEGRSWYLEAVGVQARIVPLGPGWVARLGHEPHLEPGLHQWLTDMGGHAEATGPRLDLGGDLGRDRPRDLTRGQAVAATDGLVWLCSDQSVLAFAGDESLLDRVVPVGAAWCLEVVVPGAVTVRASTDLAVSERREGVCRLQEALVRAVIERGDRESRSALVQELDRRALDADIRGVAVRRFEALDSGQGWHAEPGADPLLAACEVLGRRGGMTMATPADWAAVRERDPVRAIARASGVRVRAVTLGANWWRDAFEPILAFRRSDGAPVALVPDPSRGYRMVDPATGIEQRVREAQAGELRDSGFVFYRALPPGRMSVSALLRYGLRGSRRDLVRILILSLAVGVLSLVFPIATGAVLGSIVPAGQPGRVVVAGVILMLVVAATTGFLLTRSASILRLQGRMLTSMQGGLWDRLLSLPVQFFARYSPADLTQRVNGVDSIQQVVAAIASQAGLALVTLIFSVALLFFFNVALALLVLGLTLLAVGISGVVTWRQITQLLAMYDARGRASGTLLQVVQGIDKVRAAAAENRALRAWSERFAVQASFLLSAARLAAVRTAVYAMLPAILLFSVFAVVAAHPSMMTTADFLSFITALGQIAGAAILVDLSLGLALNVVPLFDRMRPVLTAKPEGATAAVHPGLLSGRVELASVSYRYPGMGSPVLRDISLAVEPGEFVALVGPSGSGKSTIVRLLLGFDVPETGSVTYDDKDLSSLDLRAVRAQIGVCLQNASVTGSDILSAIVGDWPLSEADAWSAAERVGLAEEIRALPMGMHTILGSDAATFSGGQRQRLVLAAALARGPRLVILDEATSTLDSVNQARVASSFEGLHVTRLVVAHRLSTIRNADRIVVLDEGQIVQQGTFDDLSVRPGIFQDMVRRQSL